MLVMATGLGRVTPEWPTGIPAPLSNAPRTVASVSATLNGLPVSVFAAELAGGYVGTYVVEVELPLAIPPGVGQLVLSVEGKNSNSVAVPINP